MKALFESSSDLCVIVLGCLIEAVIYLQAVIPIRIFLRDSVPAPFVDLGTEFESPLNGSGMTTGRASAGAVAVVLSESLPCAGLLSHSRSTLSSNVTCCNNVFLQTNCKLVCMSHA